MVTAKNLVSNSKADLGWDTRDADYTTWRNEVKDYCAQHEMKSWGGASDGQKAALVVAARGFTGFKPAMRARLASGSDFHKRALEALLQDCMKKRSETAKNLAVKRALKRPRPDEDEANEEGEDADVGEENTAVVFWVSDPDDPAHKDNSGSWLWDHRERRRLGIIAQPTIDGIWAMVKAYVPGGRAVREFWGALADPDPSNPTFPADATSLRADSEVSAFLRLTTAKPIRLLIVLHQVGQANIGPHYFSLDRFDPPVTYDEHDEDSDAVVRNAAGVRQRRLPTTDHTFEQRIQQLRYREKRQSDLKNYVKSQHKQKYPDAIHSDDEDFLYIAHLTSPEVNSGRAMLLARQVVPFARRALALNHGMGMGQIRSRARALRAAQFRWEDLQPGVPGHPGPAPRAPEPPRARRGKRPRTRS